MVFRQGWASEFRFQSGNGEFCTGPGPPYSATVLVYFRHLPLFLPIPDAYNELYHEVISKTIKKKILLFKIYKATEEARSAGNPVARPEPYLNFESGTLVSVFISKIADKGVQRRFLVGFKQSWSFLLVNVENNQRTYRKS
jgi:hypothetical protein